MRNDVNIYNFVQKLQIVFDKSVICGKIELMVL